VAKLEFQKGSTISFMEKFSHIIEYSHILGKE